MRTPSSALPASPNGLVDGRGKPLPFCFAAGFFTAASRTTFLAGFAFLAALAALLAAALATDFLAGFAAFFCFLAIVCLPCDLGSSAHSRASGNPAFWPWAPLSRGRAVRESLLLQL